MTTRHKCPVEIIKLNPVVKERIDSKFAKTLQYKLCKPSRISKNEKISKSKKEKKYHFKEIDSNKRTSIAVPPVYNVSSEGLLPLQVSNWLVHNHLNKLEYRCTLTSFHSESSMAGNPENAFSIYDILDLLGIARDSEFYRNFISEYNQIETRGMLYTLLKHCVNKHIMRSFVDAEVQTLNNLNEIKTISEKLHEIDELFKEKQKKLREVTTNSQSVQANPKSESSEMIEIQKKIEIENIKKAEQLHYENELECVKSRLKTEYERQFNLLQEQQIQYRAEIQKQRELEQQDIRQLREQLLQELDKLQKYEELTVKALEEKKSNLDILEEVLNEKRKTLKMQEFEIEKRAMQLASLNSQAVNNSDSLGGEIIDKKLKELKEWEEKNKKEEKWLQEEKLRVTQTAKELDELKPKFYELEFSMKSLQDKYTALLKQNNHLEEKIESMADYKIIKTELSYTKKELESVKKHLTEALNEQRKEVIHTFQHWKEQNILEPKQIHPSLNMEMTYLWQEHQKVLEREIEEFRRSNDKIITRNDQQQEEIQDLKKTVNSLQNQLSQAQNKSNDFSLKQTANSITTLPLPNFKQPPTLSSSWLKKFDQPSEPLFPRNETVTRSHLSGPYPLHRTRSFDKEKPLRFISEARKRIDYFQIEAEALEKKYGEYLQSQANLYWATPSFNTPLFKTEHLGVSHHLNKTNIMRKHFSVPEISNNDFKLKYFTQGITQHLSSLVASPKIKVPNTSTFALSDISKPHKFDTPAISNFAVISQSFDLEKEVHSRNLTKDEEQNVSYLKSQLGNSEHIQTDKDIKSISGSYKQGTSSVKISNKFDVPLIEQDPSSLKSQAEDSKHVQTDKKSISGASKQETSSVKISSKFDVPLIEQDPLSLKSQAEDSKHVQTAISDASKQETSSVKISSKFDVPLIEQDPSSLKSQAEDSKHVQTAISDASKQETSSVKISSKFDVPLIEQDPSSLKSEAEDSKHVQTDKKSISGANKQETSSDKISSKLGAPVIEQDPLSLKSQVEDSKHVQTDNNKKSVLGGGKQESPSVSKNESKEIANLTDNKQVEIHQDVILSDKNKINVDELTGTDKDENKEGSDAGTGSETIPSEISELSISAGSVGNEQENNESDW